MPAQQNPQNATPTQAQKQELERANKIIREAGDYIRENQGKEAEMGK
jgi:hypothetical protein